MRRRYPATPICSLSCWLRGRIQIWPPCPASCPWTWSRPAALERPKRSWPPSRRCAVLAPAAVGAAAAGDVRRIVRWRRTNCPPSGPGPHYSSGQCVFLSSIAFLLFGNYAITYKILIVRCWVLIELSVWNFNDLAKCWERLAVNAKVATVLGSIPASSDTVESEGWQMKQCWITYIKIKNPKNPPFRNCKKYNFSF